MTFPWLKKLEDMEASLDKKTELQQQEINQLKSAFEHLYKDFESMRRECESIRRGFVDLIGHTSKMIGQQNSSPQQEDNNSMGPIDLDDVTGSEDLHSELERLQDENRFLQEKIEAQQDIINKLNEELEGNE